jgi:putative ABC transport system ATP-binding protein
VAVARALVQSPRALLADEPTGNLDQETGDRLYDLLKRLNGEREISVVLVTHNERLAAACGRTLRLQGGTLHPVPRQGFLG